MLKRLFVSSCPFLKGKNRRYCYTQPNSKDIAGTLIAETSKQKCAVPKELIELKELQKKQEKELKNIKEQLTNQLNAIEKIKYYTNEQTFIIDSMSTMQNCTFIFIFLTFIRSIFH
jgi:DNA-binding transcriptional regulator GbsR (MarR family)